MSSEKKLIVIGGATASGKTSLAIALARRLNAPIISADSRQFYREMNIGTAKPTPQELAQAPHHLIGHLSITDNYSVGAFEREALALLERLYIDQDWVIMIGGSGLYIKAVCEGLDEFPAVPQAMRDAVQQAFDTQGIAPLLEELQTSDPAYYQKVDRANPARIIRAISFIRTHRQPFSQFRQGTKKSRPFTPIYLMPAWSRQALYERINQRVDQMMAAGLLEEVRELLPHSSLNSLQTVGYQELIAHLQGEMELEKAIVLIKQNSRRYAKRQLTWLRRDANWRRIEKGDHQIAQEFINHIAQGGHWQTGQMTDQQHYSLSDGKNSGQLIWLPVHKLGIIDGELSTYPALFGQLLDQLHSLAEEQKFWLATDEECVAELSTLNFELVNKPNWADKLEDQQLIENKVFYQLPRAAHSHS